MMKKQSKLMAEYSAKVLSQVTTTNSLLEEMKSVNEVIDYMVSLRKHQQLLLSLIGTVADDTDPPLTVEEFQLVLEDVHFLSSELTDATDILLIRLNAVQNEEVKRLIDETGTWFNVITE